MKIPRSRDATRYFLGIRDTGLPLSWCDDYAGARAIVGPLRQPHGVSLEVRRTLSADPQGALASYEYAIATKLLGTARDFHRAAPINTSYGSS